MNIIKSSLALGTGTLLMLAASTSFVFGSDATIDTTGANSDNKIVISSNCSQVTSQSNTSNVVNQVMVAQNTGGNSANKNTGDGSVTTGDVSASVMIMNAGNSNELTGTPSCCCDQLQEAVTTTVTNTGYKSTNKVKVVKSSVTKTKQKNVSNKVNGVAVAQETGLNKSNKNTGSGTVDTGSVGVGVELLNEGDSNTN